MKKSVNRIESGLNNLKGHCAMDSVIQNMKKNVVCKNDSVKNSLNGVSLNKRNGIEASVHFDPPVHLQSFYRNGDKLPVTEDVCRKVVTLPMFPGMKQEELNYIVEKLEEGVSSLK